MRWLVVAILAVAAGYGCGTEPVDPDEQAATFDPSADDVDGDAYVPLDAAGKADTPEGFGGDIEFAAACEPGDEIIIGAVGDLLLHERLQRQAYTSPDGAVSLWHGVKDLLEQADITYMNLEGPTAPGTNIYGREAPDRGLLYDNVVYTSYPQFNYHPSVLDAAIASGIDVVSTANNHSLDRRTRGADLTIDELDARGLAYTGTRKSTSSSEQWWTIVEAKGFQVAFLGCTYGTNGIPDRDNQVLNCFDRADDIAAMITSLSARDDVDAVIVTPHWGQEYTAVPNRGQFDLSHRFLDAGAVAIIGNHPHVIQPWERYVTQDGRETFAIYSLGNFVSGQTHLPRRTTALLYLGLYQQANGKLGVRGARYVPLHMTSRNGTMTLEAIDRAGNFGDSRNHVIDLMGAANLMLPHEAIVTNPQCDASWLPHHPHAGWVGGACEVDEACGGQTSCDTDVPDGLCTLGCSGPCPDVVGRPTTFCVDLGDGEGSCVLKCSSSAECRPGWHCEEQSRFGGNAAVAKVCVPTP